MLLLMIEKGMPIDYVFYVDTGMEFPEMATHIAKLDDLLYRERGIHVTTLKHPKGFEFLMFEQPKTRKSSLENRARLGIPPYGYGWPGAKARWCTKELKTSLINKEIRRLSRDGNVVQHIGIAADEAHRCKTDADKRYPLVDWGITEAQALQISYQRGFDWGGLYEIYQRVSCWCCPLQRIGELRNLRHYHPDLWEKLRHMDNKVREQFGVNALGQFRENWSVEKLEERFAREDAQSRGIPPTQESSVRKKLRSSMQDIPCQTMKKDKNRDRETR